MRSASLPTLVSTWGPGKMLCLWLFLLACAYAHIHSHRHAPPLPGPAFVLPQTLCCCSAPTASPGPPLAWFLSPPGVGGEAIKSPSSASGSQEQGAGREMRGGFRLGALVALWCCLAQPAGGTTEQIQVDILGTSVTLTCPWEDGEWGTKKAPLSDTRIWTANEQQVKEMEKGARYVSRSGDEKALEIYLKLKVCEGCIELGFGLAVVIILCDLLFSLGILLLVYFCSKSRAAAIRGGAGRGRPPGWKEDRPPPVPNPDYEPIRKGQQEVYAGLEPRAF